MLENPSENDLKLALKNFCLRYGYLTKLAQRTQLEIDRATAPDFSVFNLFNWGEMVLSKIMASLLSPTGSHGQGTLFLELFINRVNTLLNSKDFMPLDLISLENATALTEVTTPHIERAQRRMDILLANPPFWALAIENKPWAEEQDDQLKDYQEELNRRCPDNNLKRYVVFIPGDSRNLKLPPKIILNLCVWVIVPGLTAVMMTIFT
jgi:hypothetical protein